MADPLLTCPHCGLRGDAEVFLGEAANTRALVAALRMPEALAVAVIGYLRLHNQSGKAMAASKRERLLTELVALVQSGEVTRDGVTHAAPRAVWLAALERLVSKPPASLPLNGHGYLLEVVATEAQQAAAGAERTRNSGGAPERATTPVRLADGREFASAAEARAAWERDKALGAGTPARGIDALMEQALAKAGPGREALRRAAGVHREDEPDPTKPPKP